MGSTSGKGILAGVGVGVGLADVEVGELRVSEATTAVEAMVEASRLEALGERR